MSLSASHVSLTSGEVVPYMCGIAGQVPICKEPIANLSKRFSTMSRLIAHSRPDGKGQWMSDNGRAGGVFYCASEAQTLMPFPPDIYTNDASLAEYLAFQ